MGAFDQLDGRPTLRGAKGLPAASGLMRLDLYIEHAYKRI